MARLSIIRSADWVIRQERRVPPKAALLTRQGASSSESSGSGSVVIDMSPCKITGARPRLWTLDFLLRRGMSEPLYRLYRDDALFDGPSETVQGRNSEIGIIVEISTTFQEELNKVGYMLAK